MPEIKRLAPARTPRAQEHHLTPSDDGDTASRSMQIPIKYPWNAEHPRLVGERFILKDSNTLLRKWGGETGFPPTLMSQ